MSIKWKYVKTDKTEVALETERLLLREMNMGDFDALYQIPVYNHDNPKEYQFSGKRIYRGQYRTASGDTLNADINGALNILRKSNVVSLDALYSRGEVDAPVRIRIA